MTLFGTPHRHLSICTSTNDLAREWACDRDAPAPHGAVVTAEFQTRGRGRWGRRWDAPTAESALMSFVLRPAVPPSDLWQLGFVAALAVADALQILGQEPRLKWPNDVLLSGRKVAGVLIEAAPGFAIAGIGINVRQTTFDAADYAYPPTSLHLAAGSDWSVDAVISTVTTAFGQWDRVFQDSGFAPILSFWQARLAVGAPMQRGSESGTLAGLTPAGHARVLLPNGTFTEWLTVEA